MTKRVGEKRKKMRAKSMKQKESVHWMRKMTILDPNVENYRLPALLFKRNNFHFIHKVKTPTVVQSVFSELSSVAGII